MKQRYFFIGVGILLLTFLVSQNTFAGSMLTWDQSTEGVTGYRIYYSQVSGEYTDYVEITTNSYALSSLPLTEGITYYFIVRAFNATGESENSNEITYTAPDNTPPAQPQGLSANNQTGSLSWQANVETDLNEYRVYYGKSAGSYNPFIPVGKTTGYTFSNLEPGVQYYCAVSAVDQSGNESGYSSTVILTAPSGVGSSTVSSESGPVLSWSPSSGVVTGYRVYYGTTPDAFPNSWNAGNTTQVALSALLLEEGKTYYFVVRAYNDAGESGNSDVITWTTATPVKDTEKPVILIKTPTTGTSYDTAISTINLTGTASDNKGVTQVSWNNSRGGNGVASGTATWSISGISLADGENLLTITAADAAGNTGVQAVTVMYRLPDMVVPVPSSDLVITNLKAASGKSYPVRIGLANGSTCYIDRSYVYSEVPSYLLKMMYIQTANNDKLRTDSAFLTFDINTAATIYVVYDDRYAVPAWLSGFTNTGNKLRTESLMKIFKKDYNAGKVTLGGNGNEGNHYTVMVVKQTVIANDVEVPKIAITSPVNTSTYGTDKPSISLAGSASDNVGVVKVSWQNVVGFDSGAGGDASGTTTWSTPSISLVEGDNTIIITALDKAGNKGTAALKVKYTLPDIVKPVILVQAPAFGSDSRYETESQTITVSGVASDDSGAVQQVSWKNSRGGSGIASGTATWSISGVSLAEGDNILTITATDKAGNAGIRTVTVFYSIPVITPPPSSDLSITNLAAASGKVYKVKQGLSNGSACYIDRTYVYSEVPSYLLQSTYIQTANNDKLRTDSAFLSFTINIDSTVYVIFDDRYATPSWLSGFTNTGNKLRTESLMKIFKKDYNAGKVTLGGNGNAGNQYTVMVVKKPVVVNLSISNLKAASGKVYPVKTALANGSTCYIDRTYVYSEVPSYLLKSMFIQPANDDKLRTESSFLTFDINTAATIYVAYDDRYPVASWLSGFTNTGNKLRTESLMKIFKKDYNAGKVILGGNGNGGNQYTVIAVKK